MTGQTDLKTLLKSATPILNEGTYFFCNIHLTPKVGEKWTDKTYSAIHGLLPVSVATIRESEGLTVVVPKEKVDEYLSDSSLPPLEYDSNYECAWITLTIHSSLEAVGLTAAFSARLADNNISCNVIAGFHHDHIFVGKGDAQRAIDVLSNLDR
ncbi:hypothetical protein B0I72DRAFT_141828 [Yarrowia lipolytica]|jgi:hypothetical protein|uniref:YALI0E26686p n=2 Tax=Yarrowia lipolytica TaxID=4952 RepID=B5FVF5_YARLI|nr:YALI0E26686p [Yarrowia lipolytica CLIB122]AOW06006.1 hypothetical protein YALI1_E31679g [Yarrowia lipolytica]KAB8280655.1 hypothetical protein BKA91DRAFT_141602 [Yarrowia lipolytica]KAE8170550.1 hypothetical protein BKA90DRAFT_140661 [Yarrowia lipolytica]KAJ8057410.1 hypothetical protein LXG23DRAFT_54113 [Yarrowia lipolytica]QNP99218.1 Hypothetical protein YALI2_E00534g [Yarrowia lipolytica]|eukprot:XP_002143084.1 YALI0E26686p [Yarrowia lipolytica CLIB122]